MMGRKLTCILLLLLACPAARAQTVFLDDFEDGSATDGNPVTWEVVLPYWPQSTFGVVNGDLRVSVLQPNNAAVIGVPALSLADTSIRAQVRLESSGDESVAVFARGDVMTRQSYAVEIAADGGMWLGIAGNYSRITTDLRPTLEDIMLQIDVIGSSIKAWAWRAGEPIPATPQFDRPGSAIGIPSGFPGVYYGTPQATPGTAIYRYVHVAGSSIPEPSSPFCLLLIVVADVVRRSSNNRLHRDRW